jgi:uncharacterized membrane protein YbhN (UPF0104 family)
MVSDAARFRLRVAAWMIATALLVVLFHAVDRDRLLRVVEGTDPWLLALASLSNLMIQPFGALQWWSLLPDGATAGRRTMLRIFSLTSVANNTTPALIGHATGALLLAAEPGIGRTAALSVLALDQLAVGLVKVAILGGAAATLALPVWMTRALSGLAAIVAALLVAAIVVARRTRFLGVLRHPARFGAALACATAVKLAEAGAILCVQLAFGLDPSVRTVLIVLAAAALGSVVPIAPANIGTYEAAAYGAYRFLGLTSEQALGIAVVQHVCQLLPAVAPGYLLLSLPRPRLRIPSLRA